ncbi:serine hydrolase [Saccharothrix sp. 6-C]|uniref:serine hydrolase n=1 Tax=Saccharothrix sp. 6-C TaxID=2781735 RepID=UPI0019174845|nr:serine hydrolase [Saccharothrix sp. 6-C]QQQ77460.1 serine hydrolase [Saccharothrix sp. 6-C]
MRSFRRRLLVATALTATTVLVGATAAVPAASAGSDVNALLAESLRQAIVAQNFEDVLDLTPPESVAAASKAGAPEKHDPLSAEEASAARVDAAAARPLHQTPNMDLAVIEIDRLGRPIAMADVLLSPQYPNGVVVPLNTRKLSTDQVRYRWWDDTEWDVNGGRGTRDVLAGREGAPLDFSSPYPASVLKLMVGFGVLRLTDQGRVNLDAVYDYQPVTPHPVCGAASSKVIRQHFDEMITKSQNESTCALIKMIHDLGAWDEVNATFVELGMPTLMVTGTNPENGGRWIGSNMSSIDTAKLLLLVNGGSGVLWTTDAGRQVTRDELTEASRVQFIKSLGNQGHNEMLSTTNHCGRAYPVQGIPQLTPPRWIQADGTVKVGDAVYDSDVRPCDAVAEVTFSHKTGWVDTTGSDAGIVRSLPGKERRNYIVVAFSNLGTDYVDTYRPADRPGVFPVLYTEKYAKLGAAVDDIMVAITPMSHWTVRQG